MGFLHEHQRPDAADNARLNCQAIAGYADVMKDIGDVQDDGFAAGEDAREKMNKICSTLALAEKYFPVTVGFVPNGEHGGTMPPDVYLPTQTSTEFDPNSIMLYGSDAGTDGFNWLDRSTWTLIHTKDVHMNYPAGFLRNAEFQGGVMNWDERSISKPDTQRVVQLYPKKGPRRQQGAAQKRDDNATDGNCAPVRFVCCPISH